MGHSSLTSVVSVYGLVFSLQGSLTTAIYSSNTDSDFFSDYRSYEKSQEYMRKLETRFPDLVKTIDMKLPTFEGRYITYVKINAPPHNSNQDQSKDKPVYLIDAGMHAREWIAISSALYFIEALLTRYKEGEASAVQFLTTYEVIVVPIVNPDGYEYTHNRKRRFRKNKTHRKGSFCIGVDINRNFPAPPGVDITYGGEIACKSEEYPGPSPASEAETQNLMALVEEHLDRLKVYLSVHSHAQVIIIPWTHSMTDKAPGHLRTMEVAKEIKQALFDALGLRFKIEQGLISLGRTSPGSSIDWVKMRNPEVVSLALELPPKRRQSPRFLLPPSKIKPIGEAFYLAMAAAAKRASKA